MGNSTRGSAQIAGWAFVFLRVRVSQFDLIQFFFFWEGGPAAVLDG